VVVFQIHQKAKSQVGELDELQTFVRSNKIWLWSAVNHFAGILAWVLGDRSAETFSLLWRVVGCWHSYFTSQMGTKFIRVSLMMATILDKTYMTRVEVKTPGLDIILLGYIAKLCVIQSVDMLNFNATSLP